ncbi:MAG: Fic family protein [Saprospiraceae bacterium]|nr:Fic family protein [Saprospiraceae bacterium]
MKWVWELESWPNYEFDLETLKRREEKYLINVGTQVGLLKHVDDSLKDDLKVNLLSEEAYSTSHIEGEILDRQSVISSIKRNLGLKVDHKKSSPAEAGVAELMVDIFKNFKRPLDHDLFFDWHKMLMNGRRDMEYIGTYRAHDEPMQIISGSFSNPRLYYEAPPSHIVKSEMEYFIKWVNTNLSDKDDLTTLFFASIAHLRFEHIHPFEDGNGRIGRALVEHIISKRIGQPNFNSISKTINMNKKGYYTSIQETNHSLNIQKYLDYFTNLLLRAQELTIKTIELVIYKSQIFHKFESQLNERQVKVLLRIFDEGTTDFKGGLSASNYKAITGAPNATATRDLQHLLELGILCKTGILKSTRYFLNENL